MNYCCIDRQFCYCTGVAAAVVYGGTSTRETLNSLNQGCDILVGTPGRVLDLLQRDYLGVERISQVYSIDHSLIHSFTLSLIHSFTH